jgi:hypothetical protein
VANYGENQSQQELKNCIERFLLLFMEEDISLDIKEWMSEVKNLGICPFKISFKESAISMT